jgi:hypothetical protein
VALDVQGNRVAQVFLDAARKWPCVMIDIETLGTADDAVILEIAAVCFDREGVQMGPEWSMVVDYVLQPVRVVDGETLAWWLAPERIGRFKELTDRSETKPLLWHALNEMGEFLRREMKAGGEVWAKGDFDLRILGNAMAMDDVKSPWKYHQARELRTVMKLAGIKDEKPTEHRALADARRQVELLWEALEKLEGAKWEPVDWAAGWEEYRAELAMTRATLLPQWVELNTDVQEAWCAGVRAAMEAGLRWRERNIEH